MHHTLANLTFQPALPILHIIAMAIVLAALAAVAYWRSMRNRRGAGLTLLIMRWLVVAALAFVLMGPSRLPPGSRGDRKPTLYVMLDVTRSMLTPDAGGKQGGGDVGGAGESRIDFALKHWLTPQRIADLHRAYDLRLLSFDAQAVGLPQVALSKEGNHLAQGDVSSIVESLRQTVLAAPAGDSNNTMLLLISDGHESGDVPLASIAPLAKARGVAIHTVCLGGPTLRRDLLVEAIPQQPYLIAGEPGSMLVRVHQGGLPDARSTLHIRAGSEHVQRNIAFDGRRMVSTELPIKQDEPGVYEYHVSVDPVAGETEPRNNEHVVFVKVTNRRMRVLIVEGEPYWDTKFLAQSLRKDSGVEVNQVTQITPDKRELIVTRADGDAAFELPRTLDTLAAYDVIVLGRHIERLIDPATAELLTSYVLERGGHVVLARGQPYQDDGGVGSLGDALAPIEPVRWGSGVATTLKLAVAPDGRTAPVFQFAGVSAPVNEVFERLPGFTTMTPVVSTKPLASTLATARTDGLAGEATYPAIVAMPAGRGSVFAVLGEGLHHWSFLAPSLKQYDGAYDALWSNAIRWLVMGGAFQPGEQAAMSIEPTSAQLGKPVQIDVTARFAPDAGFHPSVKVTPPAQPDGSTAEPQTLTLTPVPGAALRLRATYEPKQTGVYQVDVDASPLKPASLTGRFSVYDIDLERLETSAEPAQMRALAEATGGVAFKPDQAEAFAGELQRLRDAQRIPVQPVFVWDRWFPLIVLVCWVGIEWLVRRAMGLL